MLSNTKFQSISGKIILLLTLLLSSIFAQSIDAETSYVQFKVRNMGVRTVEGTITGMQGTVDFDKQNPDSAYFEVTIAVNTIDTENPKRDAHLKNEDFFEIDKWPTIQFKSKKISKQNELYGVFGYLTIKTLRGKYLYHSQLMKPKIRSFLKAVKQ